MALRHHAAYTVPYNPQDWGPVGGPTAQAAYSQSSNVHRVALATDPCRSVASYPYSAADKLILV